MKFCILNSSLAFCLYCTVLDITLRRRLCHKQNKEKSSDTQQKKVAAALGGGSSSTVQFLTSLQYIRGSQKGRVGYLLQLYSGGILVLQLLGDNFGQFTYKKNQQKCGTFSRFLVLLKNNIYFQHLTLLETLMKYCKS